MDGTVLAPNNSITVIMTISAHQFRIESKEQKYLNSIVSGLFVFLKKNLIKTYRVLFLQPLS